MKPLRPENCTTWKFVNSKKAQKKDGLIVIVLCVLSVREPFPMVTILNTKIIYRFARA